MELLELAINETAREIGTLLKFVKMSEQAEERAVKNRKITLILKTWYEAGVISYNDKIRQLMIELKTLYYAFSKLLFSDD